MSSNLTKTVAMIAISLVFTIALLCALVFAVIESKEANVTFSLIYDIEAKAKIEISKDNTTYYTIFNNAVPNNNQIGEGVSQTSITGEEDEIINKISFTSGPFATAIKSSDKIYFRVTNYSEDNLWLFAGPITATATELFSYESNGTPIDENEYEIQNLSNSSIGTFYASVEIMYPDTKFDIPLNLELREPVQP